MVRYLCNESYFFGLLDKLASDATPANRDEVELSCKFKTRVDKMEDGIRKLENKLRDASNG